MREPSRPESVVVVRLPNWHRGIFIIIVNLSISTKIVLGFSRKVMRKQSESVLTAGASGRGSTVI